MDKVLLDGRSQLGVSMDYVLKSRSLLPNWLAQYKKKMGILLFLRQGQAPELIFLDLKFKNDIIPCLRRDNNL